MKLSDILHPDEYVSEYSADDIDFGTIVSDTREQISGNLFVCIRGTRFDSHHSLSFACTSGAVAAIIEKGNPVVPPPHFPVFEVYDTRAMLAIMWNRLCGDPGKDMHIIGVTGTNGKTSSAYMIKTILEAAGKRVGIIGTVGCAIGETRLRNNDNDGFASSMTTPDPDVLYPMLAAMKNDRVEYVILEASSHALALKKLDPLFFDTAVFTGLSPEHLDFHVTMDNYLEAKSQLFRMCRRGIVNADNEYTERLISLSDCEICSCGVVYDADFKATNVRTDGVCGVSYTLEGEGESIEFNVPVPGNFTVYNSMLASLCTRSLGIPLSIAAAALSDMEVVPGRLEKLDLSEYGVDFTVFIDYAHTPAAMQSLLSSVRAFRRGGRIIAVFGCGGDRDRQKRAPMGAIAARYADYVIVTSDNSRGESPQRIIMDILAGIPVSSPHKVIVNREKAIEYAVKCATPGDIILLIGKGHEQYEISSGGRKYFSEKESVRHALEKLRKKDINENEIDT